MKLNPLIARQVTKIGSKQLKDKDDNTLVEMIEAMLPIVGRRQVRREIEKNIPPEIAKAKDKEAAKARYLDNTRLMEILTEVGLSKDWLESL